MFPEIVNRNEVKGGFSQESFEGTAEGPSLRNVGKNVAMLTISHVGCRLLYLMLFAMVGRLHGVRALGGYAVATACAALVLVLTDLGVSERIVREMAPRRETGSIEYARALGFKLIAALAVWVLFVLISRWLPFEPALVQLCGLMVAGSLIETFSHLNNAVCRAHEHMELEALGSGAQAITFVGFGVLFLSWNLGLVWLGFAAIAGALVELVLTTAFARRFVRLGVRWRSSWATLRSAGPYGITSLTVLVVPHIDVLLLALVVTQTEVGEFASVSRLLHGGAYLPLIATSAMLPTATIMWVRYGAIGFGRIISDAVKVSLALGALSFAVLFVASGPIMNGLYGEDIARLQPLMKLGAAFMLLKFPVACLSVRADGIRSADGSCSECSDGTCHHLHIDHRFARSLRSAGRLGSSDHWRDGGALVAGHGHAGPLARIPEV